MSRLRTAWRLLVREQRLLLWIALLAGASWAFIELADEVMAGQTRSFDEQVLLLFRNPDDLTDPVGPRWMEENVRDLTALGGGAILLLLTAAVSGWLLLKGMWRSMLVLIAGVAGAALLSTLLKGFFERPRPQLVPHGSLALSTSFPSGHSTLAAATFLTLAVMLVRLTPERRLKVFVLSWAVLLSVAVGVSRVYLGVHWPTDVLAGWMAGAGWAFLVSAGARALQRRRKMEGEATS